MFKRSLWLIFFLIGGLFLLARSQQRAINVDSLRQIYFLTDSVDSVQLAPVVAIDSITPQILRPLDSLAIVAITDSLYKGFGYPKVDLKVLIDNFLQQSINKGPRQQGEPLARGQLWVMGVIGILLVFFAILKRIFEKQLITIVQSFFSNRILGNLNKEENVFTSWPFLLLFVQFGFTMGLFFYLVAVSQHLEGAKNGIQFFLTIAVGIVVLYALKVFLLRVMGFVFNVQKPITEYISILYLSYFNTALLFIPLVIAFALSPLNYSQFYVALAIILVAIIFVFQFIRAGVNILSNYRFSKVYLFLYFCTLEICPILILVKAIGF
jgi:hypothetical protein